jgi:hypothetical protein
MTCPDVRTPAGNRAFAEDSTQNIVRLPASLQTSKRKTGRTRYLRLFPERVCFALDSLSESEVVAWLRLTKGYVVNDGILLADDKHLAMLTKMGKRWPDLREKLIALGLGRIEGGLWIDDDQQQNLEIQRRLTNRGAKGASARWVDRHGS